MTQDIRAHHGDYLGLVNGNQAEVKAVLDDWIGEAVFFPDGPPAAIPPEEVPYSRKQQRDVAFQEHFRHPRRAPDARTWDTGHGRLEYRELWVVPAGDLGPYLAAEWGWQDITQIGWIRRYRKRLRAPHWTVEEHTVVTSAGDLAAADLLFHLRAHWTIENRVHYPCDVSWQEDRAHGRAIGPMLAWLCNLALTLIRQQRFAYVPDAWSYLAAHTEEALRWLVGKLKE